MEKADILDLTVKYVHSCASSKYFATPAPYYLCFDGCSCVPHFLLGNSSPHPSQTPWLSFLAGYSACEAVLRHLLTATPTTPLQPYTLPPRQTAALLMALEARKVTAASAFLDALGQKNSAASPSTALSSNSGDLNPQQQQQQHQHQERPSVWRPW